MTLDNSKVCNMSIINVYKYYEIHWPFCRLNLACTLLWLPGFGRTVGSVGGSSCGVQSMTDLTGNVEPKCTIQQTAFFNVLGAAEGNQTRGAISRVLFLSVALVMLFCMLLLTIGSCTLCGRGKS